MDEPPAPRPRHQDGVGARRTREGAPVTRSPGAPNVAPPDATLLVTSLRRARYVPVSTDPPPVAALIAALYNGFLAADGGPHTWQRTTVLFNLSRGLRAEAWTIADLLGRRYHLTPQELADQLAALAWEWHCTRPLEEDAAWARQTGTLTARKLRARIRQVHAIRDLLCALAPRVAQHFDEWVQASLAPGRPWTAAQAHEWAVREIVETATRGLGPDASADEIHSRLAALHPDGLPLAHDATLFAADAIKGLSGREMVQAGLVALGALEVLLLGRHGRIVTQHGRRRLLDLERDLGRRLVAFFRARTRKPLWGQAAALLIAACPSRTFVGWRTKALATAVEAIPLHQRRTRPRWSSDGLPPRARAVYRRALGENLRGPVQLDK
jgi:hypothetical protein